MGKTLKRSSILLLVVMFVGCGGGGGGGVGGTIPLKRAIWQQALVHDDGSDMPSSELQGFRIYLKTENAFLDNDTVSDEVDTSSVLTGVDNGTGMLNCEYDLRKAYYKNHLNLTDNYFAAIRSVTIFGGVSAFTSSGSSFSYSGK